MHSLFYPRNTQELSLRIIPEDYLAATFKWSQIINQDFKYATHEIEQYQELMA